MEIAEDERNEAWTDELLEKLKLTHGLKLMIEVCSFHLPSVSHYANPE
jgi:hypothetical protein